MLENTRQEFYNRLGYCLAQSGDWTIRGSNSQNLSRQTKDTKSCTRRSALGTAFTLWRDECFCHMTAKYASYCLNVGVKCSYKTALLIV
ncbi:hypothetical protein NQ318_021405 [Aromia moschata]|uniref:Uncharacterized protein n=1 Tax=Aromia moschata TaxID=1265417 RepID=A0AAV8ZBQ9_9CUCU|nr:hypothetical protein NQ318_021405 [Aromia moschata]